MRPRLRLLDDTLIGRILDEARELLARLGLEVHNHTAVTLFCGAGATVDPDSRRLRLPGPLLDRALASAPRRIRLFDVLGTPTHELGADEVYFTPGSAAIHVLDEQSGRIRTPQTADYVRYAKLVASLPNLASQSTALIPADVPGAIADSWRLFLSLRLGEKPVVTGAFSARAFEVMRDLQLAVRGTAQALREKPLCIFSCCPTAPLKWSFETSQNVIDCARSGVPVEFVSMPLSGFVSPVTLVGSVVQHAAETLSGVALSQLAAAGAPVLWGGSPAIFDIRHETTPMGAIETMMLDCANSEVGHHLGLPTQGYIALSDAKRLDAQAGLETGMGATLAALSGIDSVSGPGMLDFESCQSLEKLVVDDEICGMVQRLRRGMEPREDFPSLPLFEELLKEGHLLIASHTRRHRTAEIRLPSPVIERAPLGRFREEGETSLGERARREVDRLVGQWKPSRLPAESQRALVERMTAAAAAEGMPALPPVEVA
ncbi:MAG TPA: trimethylamine methyltransferase family protein [Vicinamibacteria bacterium]|nr:trimethylamine methyltransferase family protein [Vicinamibacteria bacterium]